MRFGTNLVGRVGNREERGGLQDRKRKKYRKVEHCWVSDGSRRSQRRNWEEVNQRFQKSSGGRRFKKKGGSKDTGLGEREG